MAGFAAFGTNAWEELSAELRQIKEKLKSCEDWVGRSCLWSRLGRNWSKRKTVGNFPPQVWHSLGPVDGGQYGAFAGKRCDFACGGTCPVIA